MFIDSHCHLNSEEFQNDIETYIKKAQENNLEALLVLGWDLSSSKKAIELAHRYDFVYAGVGLHPENIDNNQLENLQEFKVLAKDSRVICYGEIGLDYYWIKDEALRAQQREFFIAQLQIADELNLPVSIHARDAIQDAFDILKKYGNSRKGIMHCFGGSVEMMEKYEKLGYFIGLGGPVTFKNSRISKEVATAVEEDMFVIETDSPYLTPVPFRGQMNDPSNVIYVADVIGQLRNKTREDIGIISSKNFKELFHI